MSAAGVSKLDAGRLLLLCGALALAVGLGCESDNDGAVNPIEELAPPSAPGAAVLSDFYVTTQVITAGATDTLVASVVDLDGEPLQGIEVSFATSLGRFTNERQSIVSPSASSGEALAVLVTTLADSGRAVVEATLNGITRRASVTIEPRPDGDQTVPVDELAITASPAVVVADGGVSFSTITARATTREGVAVKGALIAFSTTAGFVVSPVETDSRGEAVTSLYSHSSPAVAKVGARADGARDSTTVQFVAQSDEYILELSAAPDVIRADGGTSFSVVSARLLDGDRHPVKGASVSFETDAGSIARSSTTDEDGLATANLHSGSESGVATVTASFGDESETVQVYFSPSKEPTPFTVNLSAFPTTLPADGRVSKSRLVATVLNSTNNPLEDQTVSFETSLGIVAGTATTGPEGQAVVYLYSGSETGTATVTATVGTRSGTAQVSIVSLDEFYGIEIVAAPTAIFADGGTSTAQVSATLTTSGGNPVEGALLSFTTTAGKIDGTAATDSLGIATAVLRSHSSAATATVRASFATTFFAETDVEMLPLDAPVFTIELRSSRSQLQVKGTGGIETADITAMAHDVLGNPSPDETEVTFTIIEAPGTDESLGGEGFGPVTAKTLNGTAVVPFRSGTNSGTVVIRAAAGGLATDVAPVTVAAGPPEKINLCAKELNVTYCRHEPNEICGYVCDAYNNPVADGTAVFFTVDKGCITASAETRGEEYTDENGNGRYDLGEPFEDTIDNGLYDHRGVVRAEWTDCGPGPFGTVTVTAGTWGEKVTGSIQFTASGCPAIVNFVSASPSAIPADDKSTSVLRFQVLDADGFYVREGMPVYFSTDWGTINPDTSFTRDGVHESFALATLTSQTITQDYSMPSQTADDGVGVVATVSAESYFAAAQGTVTFITGTGDLVESKLDGPSPMGIDARGIITASIKDFFRNPLGAHEIEFFCSDGLFDNGLNTMTAYTGVSGVAGAIYFAPSDTNTVVISIRDLDARGGNLGLNRVITVR